MSRNNFLAAIIIFSLFSLAAAEEIPGAKKTSVDAKLSGFIQVLYNVETSSSAADGFSIKRARLCVNSTVYDKFEYKFTVEAASSPYLLEACMSYNISGKLKVNMGQFKVPFSYEYLIPTSKLDIIEGAQVVSKLSPQYDTGIALEGSAGYFKYAMGAFNGEGRNKTDVNKAKDTVTRFSFIPVKSLEIGIAYYNARTGITMTPKECTDLYLVYAMESLTLKSEYIFSKEETKNREGGYIQLSYKLSPFLEFLVKGDTYDPDMGISEDILNNNVFALNYYINDNAKIQVNYTFKSEAPAINNDLFQVQTQLSF